MSGFTQRFYLVIFFVAGMMNAIPILYPGYLLVIPIVTGIPFMLFLTKTEKFGMVTIIVNYYRGFLVSDGLHLVSISRIYTIRYTE